jgi:hypothetical protein
MMMKGESSNLNSVTIWKLSLLLYFTVWKQFPSHCFRLWQGTDAKTSPSQGEVSRHLVRAPGGKKFEVVKMEFYIFSYCILPFG